MADNAKWYVVHTYSGYENKVKDNLEKSVENNGMQDLIFDVRVPVEDVDTVRQKLTVKVKMFLGREMPVEVDLSDVEKVQA